VNTVVIASSEQDAAAVEAVKQHHAQMAGALSALAGRVTAAATEAAAMEARDELVRWAENDLVPHAKAEEVAMYPPAHQDARARLLVDAMLVEHELILGLVKTLREATGQVRAAAEARALVVTFESHLAKENDQILPLLAERPEVSLSDALAGMHELLGGHDSPESHESHESHESAQPSGCGGGCSCGEVDGPELPELDARSVPHAIRHATIFGALDSVRSGGGLVLVAPHDPLPLLRQLEGREPGAFAIDYLERGPQAWRLRFVRN
jgi:uncharacterized protein (DUF2249 family)/hemerythrin-like domain-containing protein